MNDDDAPQTFFQRPRMSWPARIFWLIAFLGISGYGIHSTDYVVAIVPLVVMLSAFSGFRIGLLRLGGSIAAIAIAFAYAPQLGVAYEFKFAQCFGTTGPTNRFVSIGIVGLVISIAVTIGFVMLTGRFVARRPRLNWLNHWCGFLFASAQGTLAVLLLLGGVLMIEPMEKKHAENGLKKNAQGQIVSEAVLTVAKYTHESQLGTYIEQYNPFVKIPQLNKLDQVQQTVRVLNDPAKMNSLLNHPKVAELKERPETKRAVRELIEDPQIRQILASKTQMDQSSAMTLMSHPAILNLIDQPGFVDTALKIMATGDGTRIGHITSNPLIP